MAVETGILLESGTNELELLEFVVGNQHYGINVAKINELCPYQEPTMVPNAHEYIEMYFHEAEAESCDQCVDAQRDAEHQRVPQRKQVAIHLVVLDGGESFANHLGAEEREQEEGDPMVVIGDQAADVRAEQPTRKDHQKMEQSDDDQKTHFFASCSAFADEAERQRDCERVETETYTEQQDSGQIHKTGNFRKGTTSRRTKPFFAHRIL